MRVDGDQPLVDLGDAVHVLMLALALLHQRGALEIGGKHRLKRRGRSARRFLRDIAQATAARHVDGARVRLQHLGDHAHQSGLARAIAPDEADAPARRKLSGGAIQDGAPAEAHRDIIHV